MRLLDVEVLAGLDAGERRDGGHFRAQIEASKLSVKETRRTGGNQFVNRPIEIEIGVERPGL